MDPAIISALSAVLGSVVGGAASISSAWFIQRAQSKRESVAFEIRRREIAYTEFVAECSKLAVDALDNALNKPATLIQAYALLNRIRLISSDTVVLAADNTMKLIIKQYFQPNLTIEQIIGTPDSERADPLRSFSEACREELRRLQHVA